MDGARVTRSTETRPRALDRLSTLLGGYEVTQLLYVLAELRIPDLLAELGPSSAAELAERTGTHPSMLERVLRALVSLRVLGQEEDGRFALNSVSERLREDVPGSLRAVAVCYGRSWRWEAWGHLLESVRTGTTAFEHAHGVGIYEFLRDHPDAALDYNAHMAALAAERSRAVLNAYDFSDTRVLVDVGGGHGVFAETIVDAYPGLTAIVYDSPTTVAQGQRRLQATRTDGRIAFQGGDFFASVPTGGDTYTICNVLDDWQDEDAVAILRSCRQAMEDSARLLVIQDPLPTDERSPVAIFDISMMVLTGGRERTLEEYEALLDAAGFSLRRVVATETETCVLESVPADR